MIHILAKDVDKVEAQAELYEPCVPQGRKHPSLISRRTDLIIHTGHIHSEGKQIGTRAISIAGL